MPNSAYFVGLCSESTPPRTYASLGPNCRDARPTFGSVYQALLEHPGHVGRILRTVDVSQSVGTSMRPVDPRHDFMDFANSFRELPGTLEQALAGETRLHRLQPIHDSAERSLFLQSLQAPESTHVFVLYLYPPVSAPKHHSPSPLKSCHHSRIFSLSRHQQ